MDADVAVTEPRVEPITHPPDRSIGVHLRSSAAKIFLPAALAPRVRRIAWVRGYERSRGSDVLVGGRSRQRRAAHGSRDRYRKVQTWHMVRASRLERRSLRARRCGGAVQTPLLAWALPPAHGSRDQCGKMQTRHLARGARLERRSQGARRCGGAVQKLHLAWALPTAHGSMDQYGKMQTRHSAQVRQPERRSLGARRCGGAVQKRLLAGALRPARGPWDRFRGWR
jgi:hypothetical protein